MPVSAEFGRVWTIWQTIGRPTFHYLRCDNSQAEQLGQRYRPQGETRWPNLILYQSICMPMSRLWLNIPARATTYGS